jgi:hypothetical protein
MEAGLATMARTRKLGEAGSADRPGDRLSGLVREGSGPADDIGTLCDLAVEGLERMYLGAGYFPFTLRRVRVEGKRQCRREGDSLRYAINAVQGLAQLPEGTQKRVLKGELAADLVPGLIERAMASREMGALALAAWAAAEITAAPNQPLFSMLAERLQSGLPVDTVPTAWALSAAVAAGPAAADAPRVATLAAEKLGQGQAASGLFPHVLPAAVQGWARAHVGSFADQIYPIQALARLGASRADAKALAAANRTAAAIVGLQGRAGQWWWHYDLRDGSVSEGYPVYSVHQHGMAPMALLDLWEAGGADHRQAVFNGVGWLGAHPETRESMISVPEAVVWRKVGRREPGKWVRSASAVTTALRPGWHLPLLDTVFPPGRIDHECRPYEFGWLLYAWRSPLGGLALLPA